MVHDWDVSRQIVEISDRPVILAGGLVPSNVRNAILHVQPAGVDVHSGVEESSGKRDPELVHSFCDSSEGRIYNDENRSGNGMKKVVFLIIAHLICRAESPADTTLTVSFWNVENLFDLEDDPDKRDDEFTPAGEKHVTEEILDLKLNHLAEMLTDLNADILGLAEVENGAVLEMLDLRYGERDYNIIHYESPDMRGIDVALLYDPRRFTIISSSPIAVDLGGGHPTRDILHVVGKFRGVELHLFVNHWPSHWGGTEATNPLRALAAIALRSEIDAILRLNHDAEIVIMGDLNDQPTAPSVEKHLGSSLSTEKSQREP